MKTPVEGAPVEGAPTNWHRRALRLLGPLLLLVILTRVDVDQALHEIMSASPGPLVVAYWMFVPQLLLRSWRWLYLSRAMGADMSFRDALAGYAFGILVGLVTPGRLGEFIKAKQLTKAGLSTGAAIANVFADRLFDLAVMAAIGIGAITALGYQRLALLALGLYVLGILMVALVLRPPPSLRKILRRWVSALPLSGSGRLSENLRNAAGAIVSLRSDQILTNVVLTIATAVVNYYGVHLFATSIGIQVSYLMMASIAAAASLVGLLPISIMGLGTRDAVLIALLSAQAVPQEMALALSALLLSALVVNALFCVFSLFVPGPHLDSWSRAR